MSNTPYHPDMNEQDIEDYENEVAKGEPDYEYAHGECPACGDFGHWMPCDYEDEYVFECYTCGYVG